jgi:hypothetical protein
VGMKSNEKPRLRREERGAKNLENEAERLL